jgi:hypothetical protein
VKSFLLFLAFSWLGFLTGLAAEKVRVGLYLAENTLPPPDCRLASERLTNQLSEVFGFKYYGLIKAEEIELSKHWEQWVVPRKDFIIRLEPLSHQPDEPRKVDYEIYKDGFIVAKGTYELHEETPLFINGPDFKQGRFIFVLQPR